MASIFLSISCILLSAPLKAYSYKPYCEATPVEYDHTFSLFCQEDDLTQNVTKSSQSVLFPDLIPSLTKAVLTDGSEDEDGNQEMTQGSQHNYTYVTVDPRNVSDLSVWAKFDEIPPDAFSNFTNLRQLHVAQFYDDTSKAVLVRQHAFRGLSQLEWLGLHLNMSHVQIPDAVFEVESLISLGLYESDLSQDFSLRGNLPKLQLVTIYDSPNMGLDDDAFKNVLNSLNEIDLSNIKLQKFPQAISNLKNLSRLEVAATGLQEVPPDALAKSAASIVIIRLSRNRISVIHPTSFRGLSKLKVLQLAYNQIEVIPAGIFDDLVVLEVLNLSGNKIAALPGGVFDGNKHLHILDLDENPMNVSASQYLKDNDKNDAIEYTDEEEEETEDKQGGVQTKKPIDNGTSKSATTTTAGVTSAPADHENLEGGKGSQATTIAKPVAPAIEDIPKSTNGSGLIDLTHFFNTTEDGSPSGHNTGPEMGLLGNVTDIDHNGTDTSGHSDHSGKSTGSAKGLTEKSRSAGTKESLNVAVIIALMTTWMLVKF